MSNAQIYVMIDIDKYSNKYSANNFISRSTDGHIPFHTSWKRLKTFVQINKYKHL